MLLRCRKFVRLSLEISRRFRWRFLLNSQPTSIIYVVKAHRGGACEGRRRTTRSRRCRRTGGLQATPDTSISRSDQWCGRRSNTGFQRRRRTGDLQATLDASRRSEARDVLIDHGLGGDGNRENE